MDVIKPSLDDMNDGRVIPADDVLGGLRHILGAKKAR
jgi:hypothetical protein